MSFDISRLNEDVDLSGGYWIDEVQDHPGLRLKVRSINYRPYQIATTGFYRRNKRTTETDEGLITAQPATGKHIAQHLLLDWDMSAANGPFALKDGKKMVAYSADMALAVLTADPDPHGIGAEYRGAVIWAANKVAENLASSADEAAGN